MSKRRPAAWLPNESDELLLRAALAEGQEALTAWHRWRVDHALDDVGPAELPILPLAWRNLAAIDPAAPELDRLKGVYRYVWVKNQVLINAGAEILDELRGAGIDTIVLKGAALTLLYYRDLGMRLMADFDVLVPRDAALAAIDVLSREMDLEEAAIRVEDRVIGQHAVEFTIGDKSVDLHWYSLWQSSADDDFWEAARPLAVGDVPTRALAPADQLLHVCAHGSYWRPAPLLAWVADAITVIRANPELDWSRLVSQASKRELAPALAEALDYLRSRLGAAVPADAIDALRGLPSSLRQRLARRAHTRPPSIPGMLAMQWDRYSRLKRDPPPVRAQGFADQLRAAFGRSSYLGLSAYGVSRLLRIRGGRRSPIQ